MEDTPIYVNDERFLGRETEQAQFRRALADIKQAPDDAPPPIFLIHGEGGMGKSQLTRRLHAIAAEEEPLAGDFYVLRVDWELWRNRTVALQIPRDQIAPETLLDTLYRAAAEAGWQSHFTAYTATLKQRAQAESQVAQALDSERPAGSGEYTALRDLGAAGFAKLVRASSAGLVGEKGEELLRGALGNVIDGGAAGLADLRARAERFLRARAKLKDDLLALYLDPHGRLAHALGEGFAHLTRRKPLVLLLDTYEIVGAADRAIRDVIRAAGPRVLWIVAGRDNLAASRPATGYVGYSAEFARALTVWEIQELAIDHYCAYLRERAPQRATTREEAAAIHKATLGVPLALRQAADLWADGVPLTAITEGIPDYAPRADIVRLMCERVLMHVEKGAAGQDDRRALYLLAMQPRPDPDVQTAVLCLDEGHFSLRETLAELARRYSAVRLDAGARLHDAMAAFVHEYLLITEARADDLLTDIARRAIAALQARRTALETDLLTLAERVDSKDWQQTTLDLVHWLFWQDEREAWRELIPRFVEALGYDPDLARALYDSVIPFTRALSRDGQKRHKALTLDEEHYESLLDELERLAARDWLGAPDDPATAEHRAILHLWRGRWLTRQKRYPEALQSCKNALQIAAPALHLALGRAFYDLSGYFLWPDDRSNALASLPGLQAAQHATDLTPEHTDSWYRLGAAHAQLKHPLEAIEAYQKAIALDATDAYPWLGLGNAYSAQGRTDAAIEAFQKATELNAKDAYPWNNLGSVYFAQGRTDAAIEAFQKAIELDDKLAYPWHGLGNAYRDQGRTDAAIAAFQKAIALDDKSAYPWYGLGNAYRDQGRNEEAIDAYQKAIELDATLAYPWYGLGLVYQLQEKLEEALRAYQKALGLSSDEGVYHSSLSAVLHALGRTDEADAHLTRARKLAPETALYNRACLEAIAGNPDTALDYLEKALAQSSVNPAWAARDPDLLSLHTHPRFQALLQPPSSKPLP